uniref:C2H2-type domain-containing protein n=1 Tax=Hucho hucho TaxID=62062 RepID=A0A4W5RLA9_9TELE
MSKECFQTQFAFVMESVLKTAVTETTKLFETTIEELRDEISRIKEENGDLKSRLRSLENAKKSTGESERKTAEPGSCQRTSRIGKRDFGVQCVLTAHALPWAGEQHQREENQGTELHRGAYDEEGNPQTALVLIKQELDWEADYSEDYSPGYILLKKEGGEPPTLVRRQPLRELPGRALVPPGAVRAPVNHYTQKRPPTIQPTSAEAPLQGDPDTQDAPQDLSPSQPKTRGVTRGSAGQDQAPGAEQQSLVIPAAESPSTLHLTASPQSPATIQPTSTVLSEIVQVTTLSKETVQSTVTVKSTAAASECPPPVLSGLPSTPHQDTQPSPVPLHPPQPSPSHFHTDVLPVARPIAVPSTQPARPTAVPDGPPAAPPTQPKPPTVLEQSGVATATSLTQQVQSAPSPTVLTEPASPPEKQASLVTEHVQRSPTVPRPKSPAVPEKTSDEAPVQLSAPPVTTPSGRCQMSKTQFLAQLSVVPLVRSLLRLEEDEEEDEGQEDEGERLSSLPAMSTEAVTTRSVATETTPAGEKKEVIVVQVGGSRKSSRREAVLSGLRLRLRPRPQDSAPSPVVAKKPRTSPLDHDYAKVMQNGGGKSRESHVDQDVVEDTANGVTADDKSSGQGSSNQVMIEGGANTDVTSPTRKSPIGGGVGGGVSKSKKRSMTWVQAQRGLALAQAKRSRSKVTKASQRGQRSELRGLVTQTQFLPFNPQQHQSYSPSPRAASTSSPHCISPHGATSTRRTSPRQATGANVNPSPTTPPHPQPHPFKVTSTTPRCGTPRLVAAAALNLKRSPITPQPIPFTGSLRSGFKKSPQSPLMFQQAQRYRQSQLMWSPPVPYQLQQSPQAPRKRLAKNQCADCGRVLSSAAALESHASLHTGKRPFVCSACGKDFPNLKGLNRHARVHSDQRGHQCLKCSKTFVYRFGLTKHEQMVHSGVRPFACPICGKLFAIRRDMETHLRVHTGEKPFACSLCVKRFKRRVELNVHLRWHNGEKRHWCSYCGKGFLDYNNLKRHKLVHTGEKPYTCSECGKHFKQTGHLKKHLKTIHKDR